MGKKLKVLGNSRWLLGNYRIITNNKRKNITWNRMTVHQMASGGWLGGNRNSADEHAWLLPLEITLITLVYSSFKLIRAPATIITLFWPLLWCCNCLVETKNYQSMLNRHFAITTRIASRNYFVHKSALYWHSLGILEALDFNCSIFPQVLPVSPRWKQLSGRIKASQDRSLEHLWQSVAFKLSYSKVLRAIAAPSLFGLFSHTINQNS